MGPEVYQLSRFPKKARDAGPWYNGAEQSGILPSQTTRY